MIRPCPKSTLIDMMGSKAYRIIMYITMRTGSVIYVAAVLRVFAYAKSGRDTCGILK